MIGVKTPVISAPIACHVARIPTDSMLKRKPYSIAVAPLSSYINRAKNRLVRTIILALPNTTAHQPTTYEQRTSLISIKLKVKRASSLPDSRFINSRASATILFWKLFVAKIRSGYIEGIRLPESPDGRLNGRVARRRLVCVLIISTRPISFS
jgi:hypothetical protein